MNHESDDQSLRDAFQALKEHNRRPGATPDFGTMVARARAEAQAQPEADVTPIRAAGASLQRKTARAWIPLAAAAAATALFLVNTPSAADREFERLVASYTSDVASGALSSPTSALLRTPGLDLGSVPSFSSSLRGLGGLRPNSPDSDGRDS